MSRKEGLFARADVVPPPGERVRVLFYFAGKRIEARCTVRWTTDELPDGEKAKRGFGVYPELRGRDFIEFFHKTMLAS